MKPTLVAVRICFFLYLVRRAAAQLYGTLCALLVLLLGAPVPTAAQVDGLYTSLEKALDNPENVLILEPDSTTTVIPPEIARLTKLRELNLSFCNIESIVDELFQLQSIELIALEGDSALNIPDIIRKCARLPRLNKLFLNNVGLTQLPEEIGNISTLTLLSLQRNSLQSLPASIGRLQQLNTLRLMGNRIRTIPNEVADLTSLESIELIENDLQILPSQVLLLPHLKKLYLDANPELDLRSLFTTVHSHPEIQVISLVACALDSLPPDVGCLQSLRSLLLSDNDLRFLPKEIGAMRSLKTLFLDQNKLQTLPASVASLDNLRYLALQNNALEKVPEELRSHRSLETLFLSDNKITQLPDWLAELPQLRNIDVTGNPLSSEDCRKFKSLLRRGVVFMCSP